MYDLIEIIDPKDVARIERASWTEAVVTQFVESGADACRVKFEGLDTDVSRVYRRFKTWIKNNGKQIVVLKRGDNVYLVKK